MITHYALYNLWSGIVRCGRPWWGVVGRVPVRLIVILELGRYIENIAIYRRYRYYRYCIVSAFWISVFRYIVSYQ